MIDSTEPTPQQARAVRAFAAHIQDMIELDASGKWLAARREDGEHDRSHLQTMAVLRMQMLGWSEDDTRFALAFHARQQGRKHLIWYCNKTLKWVRRADKSRHELIPIWRGIEDQAEGDASGGGHRPSV